MAAPHAVAVNTSGAGDCLVAGSLWALLRGCSPLEALAHGMVRETAWTCSAGFSVGCRFDKASRKELM